MAGISVSTSSGSSGGSGAIKKQDGGSLDVMLKAKLPRGANASKEPSSLSKIAKFRPQQLKNFSKKISQNIAESNQKKRSEKAASAFVKKQTEQVQSKNSAQQKNRPNEAQGGKKINVAT